MARGVKRKGLSKKIRFEVFKRDSFTCQYCGRACPDHGVVLHVDHIEPVALGGSNDIVNLVTSCAECNQGKKHRRLDDSTVVQRSRDQMVATQERLQQLEMMLQWKKELEHAEDNVFDQIVGFWNDLVSPLHLTEQGKASLRDLLRSFSPERVADAMRQSLRHYCARDESGRLTRKSVDVAWSKVRGFAWMNKMNDGDPGFRQMMYARGILKNRINNYVFYKSEIWDGLMTIRCAPYEPHEIIEGAKQINSIGDFRGWVKSITGAD